MQPIRPSDVKTWCLTRGFHPNRTLGQNFLVDRHALGAINAAAGLAPGDAVLEVGPGLGCVTEALLDAGAHVTAVEKDHRLAAWLRESMGAREALTLIEADMLDLDLDALLTDPATGAGRFTACVSNLPYSVGTRILIDLCRHRLGPPRLVVTVQREVAERLAAGPGEPARGQAGVWVQRTHDVALARSIKPVCFWPRPAIASTLVLLTRRTDDPLTPREQGAFEALTRHAFMHRRKQMQAALRHAAPALGITDELVEPLLESAGVVRRARAEDLTQAQWLTLARNLAEWPAFQEGV